MANLDRTYGLFFPIILTDTGEPAYPGLEDSVESSLRIILAWGKSTRFFYPGFGCLLDQYLTDPNSNMARMMITHFITSSIRAWETRIKVTSVDLSATDDGMTVSISGILSATKSTFNYTVLI